MDVSPSGLYQRDSFEKSSSLLLVSLPPFLFILFREGHYYSVFRGRFAEYITCLFFFSICSYLLTSFQTCFLLSDPTRPKV